MAQSRGGERKNRIHGYTLQLGRVRSTEPRTQTTMELILFDQFDHEPDFPANTCETLVHRRDDRNLAYLRIMRKGA